MIVGASNVPDGHALLEDIDGALVSSSTPWVLDVKRSHGTPAATLPDGPFPARAFVSVGADYRGEVLLWVTEGRISGLEFAWVSDDPPTRWPRRDGVDVVPHEGEK
ncbi:hypothetical protein ACAG25_07850 [Mycobacterium sp. pV006]|uniref:hypothetical protein n=1 Tax=Mycobacterium sp. pV006 TaxID=3238983 RepID=UPI00351B06C1